MKRVLKNRLGTFLYATGLYRLRTRNRATIVLFHRVDDRVKGSPLGCSTHDFRAYCQFFARYYDVITLQELLRRMRTGADISNTLVITFDDGYRDNYLYAAPILRELGLPACFFITSRFIGSNITPFWDREYGVRSWWMTWDEVRQLREEGFEIGAHTRTHASLGRVEPERAAYEIYGSKEDLEHALGEPTTLFSYPFGSLDHITEEARALVREAGFECCLSAAPGVTTHDTDPYRIRRFAISPWHRSPMQFGFEVLLPESRLKAPAGRRNVSLEMGIEVR